MQVGIVIEVMVELMLVVLQYEVVLVLHEQQTMLLMTVEHDCIGKII
jgi:hypothetical protein